MIVTVEILTDSSVKVLWERILNLPEVTHYRVFYRSGKRQADDGQFKNVPSSNSAADIEGLSGGSRSYQFFVVAVATVNTTEILGERPIDPVTLPLLPPLPDGGMDYIIIVS